MIRVFNLQVLSVLALGTALGYVAASRNFGTAPRAEASGNNAATGSLIDSTPKTPLHACAAQ